LALLAEETRDYARALALWKRALALEDKPPYGAMVRKHLETLRAY
jgi:hypothetical protein